MRIRTKLIVLLLAIALIPAATIGVMGVQNMQHISDFAQEESAQELETQITGELNSTLTARQEEIQSLLTAREVDARSLARSAPVQNYHAASQGQMELVQEQNQQQLGYMALQMRDSIENTKQRVLETEYDGREWESLSDSEQEAVKGEVERIMAGTGGNGTEKSGQFYSTYQPGYIGDTGYFYFTDLDSNVVIHHSLDDGYNLVEDAGGSLTVFEAVKSNIQSTPEIRAGETWGVAEYNWEDTTQDGNPVEEKFISYSYYEDFDWIIAPNVYYYELQEAAVADAEDGIRSNFESYLETRTVSLGGEDRPAYDHIRLVDASGNGLVESYRTENGSITSERIPDESYTDSEWFNVAKGLDSGDVSFVEVQTEDGDQTLKIVTPVYFAGDFSGAIVMDFDYGLITSKTSEITVGKSGYMSIAGEDGTLLSHPEESVIANERSITDASFVGGLATIAESKILAGKSGLETYSQSETDTKYYVAFAPATAGGKQFNVMATVPKEDVSKPIAALGNAMDEETSSARNMFLLLFGVVAIVVLGVGIKSSASIAAPIVNVRDRAVALTEGRLDAEIESSTREDEIGELIDSFGEMQANLADLFEDLDRMSRNLQDGELDHAIETDYPGTYGEIMENLDDGTRQLRASFEEISAASDQLRAGDLGQEIATDQPGDYGIILSDLDDGRNQLSESFDQILRASEGLKAGRLDQDFETDLPGAYGKALSDLEDGFDGVNHSIAQVQEIAETVAQSSEEVTISTEEIESASQEVAQSVQEISQGADEQSEHMQRAANELNDLSATVQEIAASATQVESNANEAVARGESGRERASEATTKITQIENEAEQAVQKVSSLDEEMEQIGEIVQMINEIAEQTNLLALNASIEAARAGEAGEGFAVVADEIKTLAGDAGDATAKIEELIKDVQASTNETVEGIEGMKESVEKGAETIEETIDLFDEIAESIDEVEDGVKEISDATDDQATSAEEVVAMVDEVSSVSEETAAEASNVSAAAEEQTSSLNEVGKNVENLSEISVELQELVDRFEVKPIDSPGQ